MEVVNLNPFSDNDLFDKRKDIAENTFLELDIVLKSYKKEYGEDYGLDGISLLHSTLAYLLLNHKEKHKLASVDIDKYVLPSGVFKDEKGNPKTLVNELTDIEKIHFYANLVINSKKGLEELINSSYFHIENYDESKMFLGHNVLMTNLFMQYDQVLLLLNNKYNKLVMF